MSASAAFEPQLRCRMVERHGPALPFDPSPGRRRPGRERIGPQQSMSAVTNVMRVQQILQATVDDRLKPHGLSFARYEALVLLSFSQRGLAADADDGRAAAAAPDVDHQHRRPAGGRRAGPAAAAPQRPPHHPGRADRRRPRAADRRHRGGDHARTSASSAWTTTSWCSCPSCSPRSGGRPATSPDRRRLRRHRSGGVPAEHPGGDERDHRGEGQQDRRSASARPAAPRRAPSRPSCPRPGSPSAGTWTPSPSTPAPPPAG